LTIIPTLKASGLISIINITIKEKAIPNRRYAFTASSSTSKFTFPLLAILIIISSVINIRNAKEAARDKRSKYGNLKIRDTISINNNVTVQARIFLKYLPVLIEAIIKIAR
jgi:hypothetical protein